MTRLVPALLLAISLLPAAPATDFEARVTEFDLDNGLKCLVYVDSAAPVVSVNVFYKVGSYDEQTGHTGLSHMLEHMTFKHTDVYKPGDFDRMVDSAGGNNNGFTSTYYTGYYEDFARDRWELGLKLEAARMDRCVFPDSEFESEHQVVSEERRLHDNRPTSVFWEAFEATALLANPQRNPTIGWTDDIRRFTARAAEDWYRRHYNPANAVLVVSGDVRPEQVQAGARKYFGRLKGRPVERLDMYDIEPEQRGERRFRLHKRVSVPVLRIGYHIPGYRDSLYLAADVAASILGQGRSSRLYKEIVVDSGLATSLSCWSGADRDPSLLEVFCTPKAESLIPRIEAAVYRQIERLKTEPATEREIQRVRNQILAGDVFAREDISDIAYYLASSYLVHGDWRQFIRVRERIAGITADDVSDFCRQHLREDNRVVGMLLSEGKEQP
jgi:zinc protease